MKARGKFSGSVVLGGRREGHERMKARGKFSGSVVLGGRREGHASSHCEEGLLVRHRRKCGYRSYPLWRSARPARIAVLHKLLEVRVRDQLAPVHARLDCSESA